MIFRRTVGQDVAKRILRKFLKFSEIPTLMFVGPEGVGKATLAYDFVEALAERSNLIDRVEKLTCQDILFVSPFDPVPGKPRPENFYDLEGSVGISSIRYLKREVVKPPAVLDKRVVIFMNVENATLEAQNSMLKLLEEGWKNNIFLLITSNPHRVLPTILSRSFKLRFSPLTYDEFLKVVEKEDEELYELSGHSPGVALRILNSVPNYREVIELWKEHSLGSRMATEKLIGIFDNLEKKNGRSKLCIRIGYHALRQMYRDGTLDYSKFRKLYNSLKDVEEGYMRHLPTPFLHLLAAWTPDLYSTS